jgi:hypothetical protein
LVCPPLGALIFAVIAVVAVLIAPRQRANPIGWILLVGVLVSSFDFFSHSFVIYALERTPLAARLVTALAQPLNVSGALVAIMLLLFPNGRLPSPRWRAVVWLAVVSGALQACHRLLRPGPLRFVSTERTRSACRQRLSSWQPLRLQVRSASRLRCCSWPRRSCCAGGEQQAKSASSCVGSRTPSRAGRSCLRPLSGCPQHLQPIVRVVYCLVLDLFVIALGVALLNTVSTTSTSTSSSTKRSCTAHWVRLSRACMWRSCSGSTAFDASGEFDVWLSLLATVIVAVAFEPVRERAQRIANRLVYGRQVSWSSLTRLRPKTCFPRWAHRPAMRWRHLEISPAGSFRPCWQTAA